MSETTNGTFAEDWKQLDQASKDWFLAELGKEIDAGRFDPSV